MISREAAKLYEYLTDVQRCALDEVLTSLPDHLIVHVHIAAGVPDAYYPSEWIKMVGPSDSLVYADWIDDRWKVSRV